MADSIKQLTFHKDAYPDVLKIIITLSKLEQRKPHDTARRLILEAGQQRIKELSAPSDMTTHFRELKKHIPKEGNCQEKNAHLNRKANHG